MSSQEQPSSVDRLKNILSVVLSLTALITWFVGDVPRLVRVILATMAASALIFAFGPRRFRLLYSTLPVLILVGAALVPVTRAWIVPPDTGEPLSVDVIAEPETYLESSAYDPWWLFPGKDPNLSTLDPPRDDTAFHRWAAQQGAIPAHHTMFRIVLRGKSQDAVLVTGLRIRVLERSDPISGWFTGGGVCGVVPVRLANVDLDTTPPNVTFSGTGDVKEPTRSLTLELRRGQPPEVIEVFASTDGYLVVWYAELTYQVAGLSQRYIRIDDRGEPFQVTAVTEEAHAYDRTSAAEGEALEREPGRDGQTSIC